MRSAAAGDTAGKAPLGGSPGTSTRWQESSTALPLGWMTWAPQSVLPRLPQHHCLGPDVCDSLPGKGSPTE